MEKREIYFNYGKATFQLLLGIFIILIMLFLPGAFKLIPLLFGGSFIYFSSKGLSRNPQLIFSENELYVGFKSRKTFSRSKIKSIKIKKEKVDFRNILFLDIVRYINVKGKRQTNMNSYPIHLLDIEMNELHMLIDDFMDNDTNS